VRTSRINGEDDVDEDIPIEPRPTRRDILKAVSTISGYIDDLNNPIARKFRSTYLGRDRRNCRAGISVLTEQAKYILAVDNFCD